MVKEPVGWAAERGAKEGQNLISLTGFDVKHPLPIAALDASIGLKARFRRTAGDGRDSGRSSRSLYARSPP